MRDASNWEFEDEVPRAGQSFPGSELRRVHVPGSSLPPGSSVGRGNSQPVSIRGTAVSVRPLSSPALEQELSQFCWGAFLWGGVWAVCHRVWWGLFALIPVVGLPVSFMLGSNGRRLAWEHGQYRSFKRFRRHQRIWVVAFFVAVPTAAPLAFLTTSLGRKAVARYVQQGRTNQAEKLLERLGEGLVRCSVQSGHSLPPSTGWIPKDLALVAGKEYTVPESEWQGHNAFRCAELPTRAAVTFQYAWQRDNNKIGKMIARADRDGDGKTDQQLSVVVTCSSGGCSASKPIAEAVNDERPQQPAEP